MGKSKRILYLSIVAFFTFHYSINAQIVNTESFDNTTFPPTGWTNLLLTGTNTWTRVTTGSFPIQSPHTGVGEARFNSAFINNGQRALISPAYDLSFIGTNTATVSFWLFRDNENPTNADKIDVFMNTTATLTNATSLGTVNRPISLSPIESSIGWFQYTFNVPSSFNGADNYLILKGTSAMGNNLFIDDVSWTSYPLLCSGTPTPGNTTASTTEACAGLEFTLSLQNTTIGSNTAYQWQSSSDNITFSNIVGATSSTLTTSQSSTTYYKCVVSCSSNSGTSSAILINSGTCFCESAPFDYQYTDIGNVTIGNLNNGNPLPTMSNPTAVGTYTSFLNLNPTNLSKGSTTSVSLSQISLDDNFIASRFHIYIDYNQNGTFEVDTEHAFASENVTDQLNPTQTGNLIVPISALNGITRMRVQLIEDFGFEIIDPCAMFNYGEVEDYNVNIICPLTVLAPEENGTSICPNNSTTLTVIPHYSESTLNWYSSSTGGTSLSSTNSYTTPVLNSTTSYWVDETLLSCGTSSRTEIIVSINSVNATLTPIHLTCNEGLNGSFSLASINCGSLPFTYSIDGGSFGVIPTNLSAGNHTIIVKDALNSESASILLTLTEPDAIPSPTGNDITTCTNTLSAVISAQAITSYETITLVVPFNILDQPTETTFDPGDIFSSAIIPEFPEGTIISEVVFSYPNLTPLDQSYAAEVMIGFSGIVTQPGQSGINAQWDLNPFDYIISIPPDQFPISGGTINVHYWDQWEENFGSAECLFPTGNGVANLIISFTIPVYSTITWWNASTNGTQLGSGANLEALGTSVLPTSSNNGTYNFYAQSENNGCINNTRTLVTVNIEPANINPVISLQSGIYLSASCSGSPLTFQWYDCLTETAILGATNSIYTATYNGQYYIEISTETCSQKSTCVTVSSIGIDEINTLKNNVVLSPNPTSDKIQISLIDSKSVSIEIYDAQGRFATKMDDVSSGDLISLEKYNSGIYTLKIISELGISLHRIIKN